MSYFISVRKTLSEKIFEKREIFCLRYQYVNMILTLCLFSFQSTSTSQWALYCLSTHKEIQSKLYESLKDKDERAVLSDSLLKGVLKETLRLYPTAPFLTRHTLKDAVIGGYEVSKKVVEYALDFYF